MTINKQRQTSDYLTSIISDFIASIITFLILELAIIFLAYFLLYSQGMQVSLNLFNPLLYP